jgi:hypothetical protein
VPGDPGVLRDPEMRRLIEADPALAVLDPGEVAPRLYERAETIIKQGLERHAYPE